MVGEITSNLVQKLHQIWCDQLMPLANCERGVNEVDRGNDKKLGQQIWAIQGGHNTVRRGEPPREAVSSLYAGGHRPTPTCVLMRQLKRENVGTVIVILDEVGQPAMAAYTQRIVS